jgi:glycerophosphoryl diester phosphodiesterase
MESFYLDRPLVMAHRGAKDVAPENTLAAFEAASALGADAIELDVSRCATGEIIVIHDDTVDRTTDGVGRADALSLDALRALDAGSWFDERYAGERLPLLEEVLERMGHRLRFNIEIKGRSLGSDGIEAEIAAMLAQRGLLAEAIISSFNPAALWRMRRAAPGLARALLYAGDMPLPLRRAWGRYFVAPQALHPHHSMVDAAYMAWARRKGYRVNVWTVNEPADIRRMAALGVDAIITDHVAETRRLLGL